MFKKVLVANRGEIAVRIIRACKELGVKTVAVYSEADRDSMPTQLADEAVCIGPPHPSKRLSAYTGGDLGGGGDECGRDSSRSRFFGGEFAVCGDLRRMPYRVHRADASKHRDDGKQGCRPAGGAGGGRPAGSKLFKAAAQAQAHAAGNARNGRNRRGSVESRPRNRIPCHDQGGGRAAAEEACAPPTTTSASSTCFKTTKAEAEAAFGSAEVYLEKLIEKARHIEVQILADHHGNIVHLGERDCSVQRKHQKLIEETPSALDAKRRSEIGNVAAKASKAIQYRSAGTVEFLVDEEMNYYFLEMNTRIQVEHTVTEMTTGLDLVKWQMRIAAGERLDFDQRDVKLQGHAIECRINAEDPSNGFAPSPGTISRYDPPGGPGIRIDTHIYAGYSMPPFYDSLLAKLIAHGADRNEAIARMRRALNEFVIEGAHTTIPFHRAVMEDATFISAKAHTGFLETFNAPITSQR